VPQSDGTLVRASQGGDREAFRGLVDRYFRRILAVAMGMVRNREDALDVAQETFIKAYENLATFKGGSTFYTWLYRIAVNLCIDFQRRAMRSAKVCVEATDTSGNDTRVAELHNDSQGADPFERLKDRELGAHVRAALDELTPEHRAVILLREVEGLSYEEISQVMQCAKGTVMSRLHYARKRLQDRLRGHI
jgi:RNA polymerase sigma-70 factor (ECF subfamily)